MGQFENPWGVAVVASGNVYVSDGGCELCQTDNNNNRIEKFPNDGRFITTWVAMAWETDSLTCL